MLRKFSMRTAIARMAGGMLLVGLSAFAANPRADCLAEGFLNPPPEARLRMFWRVFGPAWREIGLHQDGHRVRSITPVIRAGSGAWCCRSVPVPGHSNVQIAQRTRTF